MHKDTGQSKQTVAEAARAKLKINRTNRGLPDGLEAAAVAKFYRDTGGTTLSVSGIDTKTKTVELSNVRGESIVYRWRERRDFGFRLVQATSRRSKGGAR